MSSEHKSATNPWIVFRDFCNFARSEDERISLDDYNSSVKRQLGLFANAIFSGGVGYLTILIGMLSGLCELAKAFAIPLVERFTNLAECPACAECPAWGYYLKEVGPLAMAALGIFMVVIFFALHHSALEKYKARRKIPSVFPEYNCSPANVTVAFIFAVLLFALCFIFIKLELNAFWILCVTAIPLCVARTASLLPVTIIGRHAGVNQVLRLTISTIVPLALGSLVLLLPRDLYFSHKDILRVVLVLQWYFLVLWLVIIGLGECLVQKYEREKVEKNKTPRERTAALKTPQAWFRRNLLYNVLQLSCLFIMLILVMSLPALLFELIALIQAL